VFNVVRGVYKGQKTLYHVWLDSMSSVYIALGKETVGAVGGDVLHVSGRQGLSAQSQLAANTSISLGNVAAADLALR
jgi:hypothetical protein